VEAVLDTNVVVSALISPRGAPGRIIAAWRAGRFVYVSSPPLLQELARTLDYPRIRKYLAWTDNERTEFMETLSIAVKLVPPDEQLEVVADDPADDRVLEAAVAGAAGYLVTGDRHLLDLSVFRGIEIVTPVRFVTLLAIERS